MNTGPSRDSHEDPERDARWLARVAADPQSDDGLDALFSLMEVYEKVFFAYLMRKLGNHKAAAHDASDALVDFWEKVGRRAFAYDRARGTPAAWLWTVLLGVKADFWTRKLKDQDRLFLGDLEESEGVAATQAEPIWAQAEEPDILRERCVANAMEKLHSEDPEGARLLWKRQAMEWKPEELAEAEGRPVGTIKNILVRVRKRARELLEPCERGYRQPRTTSL
jgi:DNA-directed RNA polymerase specialized sigma24 family protein